MRKHSVPREERLVVGMAHLGVHDVKRTLSGDEPPALAPNAELRHVGRSEPRWDAVDKVTGAAIYTVDVQLPGMLFAAVLRSPLAHAHIRALDLAPAQDAPGVRAVLSMLDAPCDGHIPTARYVGQPLAAVAAQTREAAQAAIERIRIELEPLPSVLDRDSAMRPDAPALYRQDEAAHIPFVGFPFVPDLPLAGNVRGPVRQVHGDLDEGFSTAQCVVEGTFYTQVQTHCCLEPHAIVAAWGDDGVEVWMSTQFTAGVRAQIAAAFELPLSHVRVRAKAVGGGFGSKSQLGVYGKAAVALSRLAKAPVRLVYRRDEEQMDSGNRASSKQHLRIGARRDGKLTAIALQAWGNAGIAQGGGVGGIAMALYDCPNRESLQFDVFTNTSPSAAMRGPGNTQGAFALEQSIDALAEKLAMDPVALRDVIDRSPVRREERRIGAQKIGWEGRRSPGCDQGPIKHGIGMAQSLWPANVQINSACELRLWRDGRVELLSSVQDIGTGIGTLLKQVVAEELGLQPRAVDVCLGDTEFPSGPPSYGSRTSASITPPARTAAWKIKTSLLEAVASHWGVDTQNVALQDGWVHCIDGSRPRMAWREAAATLRTDRISAVASRSDDYAGFRILRGDAAIALNDLGGVQFARVRVDTQIGAIQVERVVAVHDCGRPINPLQIESQIHGGVLMGISYALLEERILDPHTGWMLNANLIDYKCIGAGALPDIEVVVLENYQGLSATDAYGVAEPANIATAAAVANAVYNATGVRMHALPMTPARVLEALHDAGRSAR